MWQNTTCIYWSLGAKKGQGIESGLKDEVALSICVPSVKEQSFGQRYQLITVPFSSVSQSYLILWDLMDCSTPGFPIHHQLLKLAQTHLHRVDDAIQPSHLLSSPSPSAFNLSQHQGLFQWVSSSYQFSSVQFTLSRVWLFATPWTTARQASLSITNSWSLPKPMSIESVMPSCRLILYHPLLILPPILPSMRVFSNELTLLMR